MEKDTILEVTDKLTGCCYPYGSESIDGNRFHNLLLKTWVVEQLLDEIVEAGQLYNRSEYSILKISNKANQFLVDIRDWLDDINYLPPKEMEGEE